MSCVRLTSTEEVASTNVDFFGKTNKSKDASWGRRWERPSYAGNVAIIEQLVSGFILLEAAIKAIRCGWKPHDDWGDMPHLQSWLRPLPSVLAPHDMASYELSVSVCRQVACRGDDKSESLCYLSPCQPPNSHVHDACDRSMLACKNLPVCVVFPVLAMTL